MLLILLGVKYRAMTAGLPRGLSSQSIIRLAMMNAANISHELIWKQP